MISNLTDNGVKMFNSDLNWYKQLKSTYKKERLSIEKLTKWMLSTVSPAYKGTMRPLVSRRENGNTSGIQESPQTTKEPQRGFLLG
jgi:hypothetical protein